MDSGDNREAKRNAELCSVHVVAQGTRGLFSLVLPTFTLRKGFFEQRVWLWMLPLDIRVLQQLEVEEWTWN